MFDTFYDSPKMPPIVSTRYRTLSHTFVILISVRFFRSTDKKENFVPATCRTSKSLSDKADETRRRNEKANKRKVGTNDFITGSSSRPRPRQLSVRYT